ncbi:hypothetical protein KY290_021359 [Solanum tuberosum]|uniref:Uncharacterized protein n=1 Tax=Solanum tuberosum TaxID=4113 RepID=A0ABQ7V3C0_SOLTU|nr:hypothetical protein KY289_020524 [Solanum tuberosum]KAH0693186.1 hypothetical protein KY285_020283 [Solanum tuberosum]KAH0757866.1 hypothetical protein KY290_021359 [Solanum tuberosum]
MPTSSHNRAIYPQSVSQVPSHSQETVVPKNIAPNSPFHASSANNYDIAEQSTKNDFNQNNH